MFSSPATGIIRRTEPLHGPVTPNIDSSLLGLVDRLPLWLGVAHPFWDQRSCLGVVTADCTLFGGRMCCDRRSLHAVRAKGGSDQRSNNQKHAHFKTLASSKSTKALPSIDVTVRHEDYLSVSERKQLWSAETDVLSFVSLITP